MKKYLLPGLLTCLFFSPLIYAEEKSTSPAPALNYSSDYAKENPPKVAPGSYYYVKEKPGDVTPASGSSPYYIKEGPVPDYANEKPIAVTPAPDYRPHSIKSMRRTKASMSRTSSTPDYNPWFVPFDILITRPLGLAATLTGTALFVVFSPFTALSSIAPPHDAFERTADVFIVVPATYTFLRPVGKFLCPGDCRPADIK